MHWVCLAATILMTGPNPYMRCKVTEPNMGICENRTLVCHVELSEPVLLDSFECFNKQEIDPVPLVRSGTPFPHNNGELRSTADQ